MGQTRTTRAAIAGVIDLGTVETFSVFQAARRGLIDQDSCQVLLQAQLVLGGLVHPVSAVLYSLDCGLTQDLVDARTQQSLLELQSALDLIKNTESLRDRRVLPAAAAVESGFISEEVGLQILHLQLSTGGLRDSSGRILSLEQAEDTRALSPRILSKLHSRLQLKELIDPNSAEKVNMEELKLRCIIDDDSDLLLLPVKQQPGGTVRLRSGRKVGIFRAVQEGLIDRKVIVRLLEAQLFAGGISDPRSGHRLTIGEATRHGLMDQDLACTMLARQLQNGGILDPLSGERLGLEESICRDLLSPRLALLVLESLWSFMGLLWPESGELMSMAEALQQGVISGALATSILRQRHAVGGLYDPETLQVLLLDQADGQLEPDVVQHLREIHIPDVPYNTNQSGTPSLNRLSWSSTSSSPPPSPPARLVWDRTDPEEQAKHKLLLHIMAHSYVDAHSGTRLVLLDQELTTMVKESRPAPEESGRPEPAESLTLEESGMSITEGDVSLSDEERTSENEISRVLMPRDGAGIIGGSRTEDVSDWTNENGLQREPSGIVGSKDLTSGVENKIPADTEVKEQMSGVEELIKSPEEVVPTQSLPGNGPGRDSSGTIAEPLDPKPEEETEVLSEPAPGVEANTNLYVTQESGNLKPSKALSTGIGSELPDLGLEEAEPVLEKPQEDAELDRLVLELQQGGLMMEDGDKLLPDEAVAQGVLPGHIAVKLMAKAGLFGGFLDASSAEPLSMEEVMQEGLLDEDLMWSVLKSDKTIAGVVDVEKRQLRGVRDAAQVGLIDSNTAARLLEAQVASGGVVDLRRDKKVSVTLAANLGLIDKEQREELVALEKAFKGRDADSPTKLMKASLQLQMDGIVDPESKSPVPLEQALKNELITSQEAYQVLAKQVAEGGIIHHASGMRLSVSDAVDRGLADRSIAPGLEDLEWVYQGKVSNPEAIAFQASTGAVSDPETGVKLTLAEAVSKGLLDQDTAREVMSSPAVTKGAVHPQTARVVPYSELVNQGRIDIETGKRFLEVKPFQGVWDHQTRENLTLSEAVALKRVDPVPALRLLQSQADSGGIIDIRTGERLPHTRGLVGDDMVAEIASNQLMKGGLVGPASERRVSSLRELLEADDGSGPDTTDSETPSRCPPPMTSVEVTRDDDQRFTPVAPGQILTKTPEEEASEGPEPVEASPEPDQSMDILLTFASNVERRIQRTIEEIKLQKDAETSEVLLKQEPGQRLVQENVFRGETTQMVVCPSEEDAQDKVIEERKDEGDHQASGEVHTTRVREDRETRDRNVLLAASEKTRGEHSSPQEDVKRPEMQADARQSDQVGTSASQESENKTKKKRKSKKKSKGKEMETRLPEVKHPSRKDAGSSEAADEDADEPKGPQMSDSPAALPDTPQIGSLEKTDAGQVLVKREQEEVSVAEKDEAKTTLMKDPEEVDKEVVLVSEQQEPEKNQELLKRTTLGEEERAALVLKAKEGILKKVFEKNVSEKQAAEELEALRCKEVRKKESKATPAGDQTAQSPDSDAGTRRTPRAEDEPGASSNETEKVREGKKVMEASAQTKEAQQSKRSRKSKKSSKAPGREGPDAEEAPSGVESAITPAPAAPELVGSGTTGAIGRSSEEKPAAETQSPTKPGTEGSHKNTGGSTLSSRDDLQVVAPGPERSKRIKSPPGAESPEGPESPKVLQQLPDTPEIMTLASGTSEVLREADPDVSPESLSPEASAASGASSGSKSSLARQECLEHDQRIVALVSMVRHAEVRLKRQQQQSVGRGLVGLDDIISQTETLDLELRDLEPEIRKEVEAAERLLNPKPDHIPLQLLLALEKDGRSLARGYEAAKVLSEGILRSLRDRRASYKEAVTAQQRSLGRSVDTLLLWLKETEGRMDRKDGDRNQDEISQQLHLCKELQSSLSTRSSEVNDLVFDIQLFISERAQDLSPDQSRQLLGQLQQLQGAFHRAWGQAEAWAEVLSAQQNREDERRIRERLGEDEKEREVWEETR